MGKASKILVVMVYALLFIILVSILVSFYIDVKKVAKGGLIDFGFAIIMFIVLCLLMIAIVDIADKLGETVLSRSHNFNSFSQKMNETTMVNRIFNGFSTHFNVCEAPNFIDSITL